MPASQDAQTVDSDAPTDADAVPTGQFVQLDWLVIDWYLPNSHAVQPPAPPVEYVPISQLAQATCSAAAVAASELNCPAGQLEQIETPPVE